MKLFKSITLVLIVMLVSTAAMAQNADAILAKYFENIGGLDKWKNIKSMKSTGKMSMSGLELPLEMEAKSPAMMRLTIDVQGQKIIQATDGTTAWLLNPLQGGMEPMKLPDDMAKELNDRKFEIEFIDYQKKGHEVTLEGEEEIDGVKCYKIKLVKNKNNDQEDVTEIHYFDKETYVPIMMISYARSGPMKGAEARTYFSDYQEVDGVMIAFFTEVKANGQTIQKLVLEKVLLNVPIEDAVFAFPKK